MRLVVAIALDEPWSVISRLVAYAAHAQALGLEIVFKTLSPEGINTTLQMAPFTPSLAASISDLSELVPREGDVVLFSAPKVHHTVTAQYGRRRADFIHLVQSGLAASAVGELGYGYRLFQKPMTRVVASRRVEEDIVRLVGEGIEMTSIDAGFMLSPFKRTPLPDDPFRVVINAFDGDFTGRVVDIARERGFAGDVKVVEASTPFEARVAAYRASSVLLAAPRFGEGLYQPAFEAMAAGCAVIMTNCEALTTLPDDVHASEVITQGDLEGMVRALSTLEALTPETLTERRAANTAPLAALSITGEAAAARAMFARVFQLEETVG